MLTHKDFFFCYDDALKEFLRERGFKYITTGLNVKTLDQYYMFEKTYQLTMTVKKFIDKN